MIGTRLGPYEITDKLGEGGMGEVWRARDTRLGREVAIKVLPPEVASDAERLRRFEHEARAASALNHPGILTVHDIGNEGGVAYLVTELLEGESLRERLRRGPIPEREALALGAEIARALAVAHAKGIVHRDLKPENLFSTADGRIKILDFGLARWAPPAGADGEISEATTMAGLTEAGTVLGTVGYMAPEQARGLPADARADLFALGCVVYEMLTGRRAFDGTSAIDTLSAILNEDPLAAPADGPDLSDELVRLLRHALEKEPTRRFQTASDVAFAFDNLREGSRPSGVRAPAPEAAAQRRGLRIAVAAAVILILLVGIALWRGRSGSEEVASRQPIRSIAVLPFVNERGAAELDYLGDGLAESLIGKLSPLPGLKVLARSTVFRFRGPEIDPVAAGRRLEVGAVLSGRVDQRDERLVVRAELIDVATGAQLWGDRFDRTAADLFAIEEEVARQIVERLAVRLGGEDSARLAAQPTESDAAYRLYLQGRYAWYQRTVESVRESLALFQRAVALDPDFALAWTGICDAYVVGWANYIGLPKAEAYARGKAAAERAVALAPDLAEARASLGQILFERDWDWGAAEREFRRAIELNPGYASAHQALSELLYATGRFEESLVAIRRAIELDPGAAIMQSVLGWSLLASGDAEAAAAQFRATLSMQPGFIDAVNGLPGALWLARRPEAEIFEAFLANDVAFGLDSETAAGFRRTFEREGLSGFWRERLHAQLGPLAHTDFAMPVLTQWSYAMVGEKKKALDLVEQMVNDRSPEVTYLATGFFFAPLRSEPRYERLLERVGLAGKG